MFVNEGKTYHSLKEASTRTGYDEKTIKDLIKENSLEAEYVTGAWALTEMGMKKLELKKKRESKPLSKTPEPKEPEKAVVKIKELLQEKKKSKKRTEPPGTSVKFNSEKGYKVIDCIREVAKALDKPIKEVTIDLCADSLKKKMQLIKHLKQVEEEKMKILEQLQ